VVKIYYDHNCALCKELARLGQALCSGNISFLPWQHFSDDPPRDIAVEVEGQLLKDQVAWEWITKNFPGLKSLDWFADRMGLKSGQTSRLLRGSAHIVRSFCKSCSNGRGLFGKKIKPLAR